MATTPRLFGLARMTISSTGSSAITLNAPVTGFVSFDTAYFAAMGTSTPTGGVGVQYAINDTTQSELGTTTYWSSNTKLGSVAFGRQGSSLIPLSSKNFVSTNGSATSSGTPIDVSNAAQVVITPTAYSFGPPTVTVLATTTAAGTYTTPANVSWLRVQVQGAGGGGAGAGIGGSGGLGGDSSFSGGGITLLAGGGGGGNVNGLPGGGGTGTGGDVNLIGDYGGTGGGTAATPGGTGGIGFFPGRGRGGLPNGGGTPDTGYSYGTGGGGATAASTIAANFAGGGGGGGGYTEKIITNPISSYSYAVGSAGAGGSSGAGAGVGNPGKAGTQGIIIVTEFYS